LKQKDGALVLLIFSITAGSILCLTAVVCGLTSTIQLADQGLDIGLANLNILIAGIVWCILLLAPGARYAVQRLQNQEAEDRPSRLSGRLPFAAALAGYPVILLLGTLAANSPGLAVWLLPVLHVLAATIPVYAISRLALRGLDTGSALRRWGLLGLGLVLGPGLVMVLELSTIGVALAGFIVQISSDQSRAMEIVLLAQRLQYAQPNPETIFNILSPYLMQPMLLFGIAAFVTAVVPLIEETLKPIGVWLLAGRKLTPLEGFSAGILSGAGYALFENLFITSPGIEWAIVSIGRIGTTSMHMLTAGITGYALATAWKANRYLRLGLLFASSVLIHALWNSLTLLGVAGTLPNTLEALGTVRTAGQIAAAGLVFLFAVILAGLSFLNRRLQRQETSSHAIIPPLSAEVPVQDEIPTPVWHDTDHPDTDQDQELPDDTNVGGDSQET